VLNVCERDGDATHRRIVSGDREAPAESVASRQLVTVVELMRMPVRLTSTAAVWSMVDTRTFMPEPESVERLRGPAFRWSSPGRYAAQSPRQPDTVRRR